VCESLLPVNGLSKQVFIDDLICQGRETADRANSDNVSAPTDLSISLICPITDSKVLSLASLSVSLQRSPKSV